MDVMLSIGVDDDEGALVDDEVELHALLLEWLGADTRGDLPSTLAVSKLEVDTDVEDDRNRGRMFAMRSIMDSDELRADCSAGDEEATSCLICATSSAVNSPLLVLAAGVATLLCAAVVLVLLLDG